MIKTKYWILLFALLLVLSALAAAMLWGGRGGTAEVISEGEEVCTLDLSRDQTLTVESSNGVNVLVVEDGAVRVESATCPDQTCVHQGARSGGVPIVCLPNRLVVRFSGDAAVDASTG